MKEKIYYEIYKDGKFVANDFCYHYDEALKEVYKDKGYTIKKIEKNFKK